MTHKTLLAIAAALIGLVLAVPALASAKSYVLKHPKHEHCRSGYVRKVEKVKLRKHGHVVKVRETVCVHTKSTRPTALATQTTLTGEPDKFFAADTTNCYEIVSSVSKSKRCDWAIEAKVTVPGEPFISPSPVFDFTNPASPGRVWTYATVLARPHLTVSTKTESGVTSTLVEDEALEHIAEISGSEPWTVVATYPGSSKYLASKSAAYSLAPTIAPEITTEYPPERPEPKPEPKPKLQVAAKLLSESPTAAEMENRETPKTGEHFAAVELELTNGGSTTIKGDVYLDMLAVGTNDQTYEPAYAWLRKCTDFNAGAFTLLPGTKDTGCVVFELPNDATVEKVQFTLEEIDFKETWTF